MPAKPFSHTNFAKASTTSNQIGIMFFYVMSYELLHTVEFKDAEQYTSCYQPSPYSVPTLIESGTTLPIISHQSDEELLLNFANKFVQDTRDIEPEISQAITKFFWDRF